MNYTYNNGMKNIDTNTMSSSKIRRREEHNLKVLNNNVKQKIKSKKIGQLKNIEEKMKLNKERENNRKEKDEQWKEWYRCYGPSEEKKKEWAEKESQAMEIMGERVRLRIQKVWERDKTITQKQIKLLENMGYKTDYPFIKKVKKT